MVENQAEKIHTEDTRPRYETPKVQVMTEREILNTFQITQAMATWWGAC